MFTTKKRKANLDIAQAISDLASENQVLETRKEKSLSIFKNTVEELESINNELRDNADEAQRLSGELLSQASIAEKEIAANSRVIDKIQEIFS